MIMASHEYQRFAKEYSKLDIKDTFYLAYRDIPGFIEKYVKGRKALDFGCGGGRSTRFLKKLGLETIGIDASQDMITEAKKFDLEGEYHLIKNNRIPSTDSSLDLILVSLVLMEIPSKEKMKEIFFELNRVLKKEGIIIIVTDAENMYRHDCASFIYSYLENKDIKSGMQVKIGFRGTDIIFYDYYWTEKDYREIFSEAGFEILELHKPLATGKEPFKWYSETKYPHFAVYILKKSRT
ncbi:MAG: methyltransferase domain-containing protein [archaeon]